MIRISRIKCFVNPFEKVFSNTVNKHVRRKNLYLLPEGPSYDAAALLARGNRTVAVVDRTPQRLQYAAGLGAVLIGAQGRTWSS